VAKVVGAAELEVVEVGALDRGLVHAADAMPGEHGSGPDGHVVAAAGASEHQGVGVGTGRELAADRLDHQGGERDLADAGVALGAGLEAAAEPAGLVAHVDHLEQGRVRSRWTRRRRRPANSPNRNPVPSSAST
jgi:hypothetical protein